jgi:hypothetical protein
MRRFRCWRGWCVLVALAVVLPIGAADAVQFTPDPNDRLHFVSDGPPGAEWNTGGVGVNGQIVYRDLNDANDPGLLTMDGVLDVLNFFSPGDPNCSGNTTNCQFDFGPDVDFTIEAMFDGMTVTPLGFGFFDIIVDFTTNPGTPDIVMTDPTDSTVVLEADFVQGFFNGDPIMGFQTKLTVDPNGQPLGDPTVLALSLVDPNSLYASLFTSLPGSPADNLIRLDLSEFFAFDPNLPALIATAVADPQNPFLDAFTAEGQGQIFRVAQGSFVIPEPSALWLTALGLAALATRRASRR